MSEHPSRLIMNKFLRVLLVKSPNINPIPTKGGHFDPRQTKVVSHFHSFMTRVTIFHDFVHFSIPLVSVKSFLKKRNMKFHKIEKRKFFHSDSKHRAPESEKT